jgi:hypothetical protein
MRAGRRGGVASGVDVRQGGGSANSRGASSGGLLREANVDIAALTTVSHRELQ